MNLKTIHRYIKKLYPLSDPHELAREITSNFQFDDEKNSLAKSPHTWSEKDCLLITYGDTFLDQKIKPLKNLNSFLTEDLEQSFSMIHILPFFPYSSDDGFAVIDYEKVRNDLGNWEDIRKISNSFKIVGDVVINHISSQHNWFQQFIESKDPGKNFIKTCSLETDVTKVTRPRNSDLLSETDTADGKKLVWCTFSHDQIDLDFSRPAMLMEFIKLFKFYYDQGIRIFRLDAVGFIWKKSGTSCLNLPEVHELVKLIRAVTDIAPEPILLLTETNVPNHENLQYFGNGNEAHLIYNFSLPPLLVHALLTGQSEFLRQWMMTQPPTLENCTSLNFTASHDGIGLRPLEGLLPENDIDRIVKTAKKFGGEVTTRKRGNKDVPYELNITYFDILKGTFDGIDNYQIDRFIASQTIMMSIEGIPAFYIQSLFGAENDIEKLNQTGHNRAINRHQWDLKGLRDTLKNNKSKEYFIFNELKRRITIRKLQRAFHPDATQFTLQLNNELFGFWRQSLCRKQSLFVVTNLTNSKKKLELVELNLFQNTEWYELLSSKKIHNTKKPIFLKPYQTVWITNFKPTQTLSS
ncbi:MAG: alpha-amylase [Methylococcaceae bacterium TMED69]|nr:MAG: alpha-amylase [Methylococcaceae bacterium TMED69]